MVNKIALATSAAMLRIGWLFNAQITMATKGVAYIIPSAQQLNQAIVDFGEQ